jgi:hypothetical protein
MKRIRYVDGELPRLPAVAKIGMSDTATPSPFEHNRVAAELTYEPLC